MPLISHAPLHPYGFRHKDGTAVYSETDDGARLRYGEGHKSEHRGPMERGEGQGSDARTAHRVAEVRALLRQMREVGEQLGAQVSHGGRGGAAPLVRACSREDGPSR